MVKRGPQDNSSAKTIYSSPIQYSTTNQDHENEQAKRMDQREKSQEEIKEQLAQMMDLIMNISKGKTLVEEPTNQASQQISSNNDSMYQPPISQK